MFERFSIDWLGEFIERRMPTQSYGMSSVCGPGFVGALTNFESVPGVCYAEGCDRFGHSYPGPNPSWQSDRGGTHTRVRQERHDRFMAWLALLPAHPHSIERRYVVGPACGHPSHHRWGVPCRCTTVVATLRLAIHNREY